MGITESTLERVVEVVHEQTASGGCAQDAMYMILRAVNVYNAILRAQTRAEWFIFSNGAVTTKREYRANTHEGADHAEGRD